MDAVTQPDLAAQNIFAPELLECPHPYYAQLREHAPVVQNLQTGIFQISSYDLIVRALLSRVRGWRFAEGRNDFTHHHSILLRGLKALHLAFDR